MREFINQYLINALYFLGFSRSTFDVADPVAVLLLFIFSTHILAFILAILIWIFVYSKHQHYKGGADFGGLMRSNNEIKTHSYGMDDMFKKNKTMRSNKKLTWFSALFSGFVIPVSVLFAIIYALIWIIRDALHV